MKRLYRASYRLSCAIIATIFMVSVADLVPVSGRALSEETDQIISAPLAEATGETPSAVESSLPSSVSEAPSSNSDDTTLTSEDKITTDSNDLATSKSQTSSDSAKDSSVTDSKTSDSSEALPTTEPEPTEPTIIAKSNIPQSSAANLEKGATLKKGHFSAQAPTFSAQSEEKLPFLMASPQMFSAFSVMTEAPEFNLNKTITTNATTPYGDDGRTFSVNLDATVKTSTVTRIPASDIVLVLDRSGSMASGTPSKISQLKTAANNFVDTINSVSPDSTVSVVSFASLRYEEYAYFDYVPLTYEKKQGNKWVSTTTWEYVFVGYVSYGAPGFSFNISSGDTSGTYTLAGHTYFVYEDGADGSYVQMSSGHLRLFSDYYGNNTYSNYAVMDVAPTILDSAGNVTLVKNAINSLDANGATRSDTGLASATQALAMTDYSGSPARPKYVIFFTDGVPTSSSTFDPAVAAAAVSNSNILKDTTGYNAKIFSVGVFTTIPTPGSDVDNFMRAVASDPDSKYYITTTNAGDLNNIFQSIAEVIGADFPGALVQDVIGKEFDVIDPVSGAILQPGDLVPGTNGGVLSLDSGGNVVISWDGVTIPADLDQDGNPQAPWSSGAIVLRAKTDFIGGNYVATNQAGSGIYQDGFLLAEFLIPHANVAILTLPDAVKDINVFKKEFVSLDINQMAQNTNSQYSSPAINIYPNFAWDSPIYPSYGSFSKDWYLENTSGSPLASVTIPSDVSAPYDMVTYLYRIVYHPNPLSLTPAEKADAYSDHLLAGIEVLDSHIFTGGIHLYTHTGTMTITRTSEAAYDSSKQSSIYRIIRTYTPQSSTYQPGTLPSAPVVEVFYEVVEGDGSKILSDLPIGNYVVEDESDPASTNWSWRFKLADPVQLFEFALVDAAHEDGGNLPHYDVRIHPYWLDDVDREFSLFH